MTDVLGLTATAVCFMRGWSTTFTAIGTLSRGSVQAVGYPFHRAERESYASGARLPSDIWENPLRGERCHARDSICTRFVLDRALASPTLGRLVDVVGPATQAAAIEMISTERPTTIFSPSTALTNRYNASAKAALCYQRCLAVNRTLFDCLPIRRRWHNSRYRRQIPRRIRRQL